MGNGTDFVQAYETNDARLQVNNRKLDTRPGARRAVIIIVVVVTVVSASTAAGTATARPLANHPLRLSAQALIAAHQHNAVATLDWDAWSAQLLVGGSYFLTRNFAASHLTIPMHYLMISMVTAHVRCSVCLLC